MSRYQQLRRIRMQSKKDILKLERFVEFNMKILDGIIINLLQTPYGTQLPCSETCNQKRTSGRRGLPLAFETSPIAPDIRRECPCIMLQLALEKQLCPLGKTAEVFAPKSMLLPYCPLYHQPDIESTPIEQNKIEHPMDYSRCLIIKLQKNLGGY